MKRFVEGDDRHQVALLPECLDYFITEDNPVRVIDAFVEEARMVMKPTRATPIIRADAVAAVRRGLRRAFSVARWPVAPDTLVGRPSTFMTGRAITGANTNIPKMMSSTPRPRS